MAVVVVCAIDWFVGCTWWQSVAVACDWVWGVVGLGSTMKLGSAMELRSVVRWRTSIVSVR